MTEIIAILHTHTLSCLMRSGMGRVSEYAILAVISRRDGVLENSRAE